MYRFPTTCSKAVCPHTAYQIVVGGATSDCFAASGTGPDRSDPIHSNNLLLDQPVQFYLDRAISNEVAVHLAQLVLRSWVRRVTVSILYWHVTSH